MAPLERTFESWDLFSEQQMHATGTPGMALAVTDGQDLLHLGTYGFRDAAAKRPVEPGTLFEIGSISKSFTAIALLQLWEAGLVDLHKPLVHYLPWFHVPWAGARDGSSSPAPITAHHLLTHTAGIVQGTDFSTEASYEVWSLRHTEAIPPPGSRFYYSNVGYKALGLLLQTILGERYEQIILERILEPLGMAATDAVITHETRRWLAVGYEFLYDDRPFHASLPLAPATWLETNTADGSIVSTAADMAAYVRLLLNRGQGPQGRILSEEAFRLLAGRHILQPEEEGERTTFYGYGLDVSDDEGHVLVGHGGGMVGYYSAILADLDEGLGVVVLSNGPGEPEKTAHAALRFFRAARHGQELPLPALPDPTRIENAADYAGTYRSGEEELCLVAREGRLILDCGRQSVALEQRGPDLFYVPHPAWARFLLRFGRHEGQVVEVFYGGDTYVRAGCTPPAPGDDPPAAWAAYPGHYRCHNPWHSNFRVMLRQNKLLLIEPWGEELTLAPLAEGLFRVEDGPDCPERLRFETILDGQALRANLSGCDYYRTFTP